MFLIALILYVCGAFLMFGFMKETDCEIDAKAYATIAFWPYTVIGSMWLVIKALVKK